MVYRRLEATATISAAGSHRYDFGGWKLPLGVVAYGRQPPSVSGGSVVRSGAGLVNTR
jgi:hypothetical protein